MNMMSFARFNVLILLFSLTACGGGGSDGVNPTGVTPTTTATGFINWSWVGGSDTFGQPGDYGTKGVVASTNFPKALEGAMTWTDVNGNLWLFGGGGDTGYTDFNDLWKFDGTNWTWMHGTATPNDLGVYGQQGIANGTNLPGARQYATTWVDNVNGDLWLFGGYIRTDALGTTASASDLWRYHIASNEWTWMNGANIPEQPSSVGGALGSDYPGARWGAASWIDSAGTVWLFGGKGVDSAGNKGYLNDLWQYNTSTNQWTWKKGSVNTVGQDGNYGQLNIESATNMPGARQGSVTWRDANDNQWMFGGFRFDAAGNSGTLSDLWKFNVTSGIWTWVSGSNTIDQAGKYGTAGTPNVNNIPGARRFAVSWKDSSGNFWLFGGYGFDRAGKYGGLNDLWKFEPVSKQWTWMSGSNAIDQAGSYIQSGADPANVPGNRDVAVAWTNAAGLWLFGGQGVDAIGFPGYYNDLWRFTP